MKWLADRGGNLLAILGKGFSAAQCIPKYANIPSVKLTMPTTVIDGSWKRISMGLKVYEEASDR